jgi:probable HAF family extracellular repeat protein
VVGTYYSPDYVAHAFAWSAGVLTKLPSLGGKRTVAVAVNDAGVIIGVSHLPRTQGGHAVKWVDGVLVDLGGLGYTNYYGDATYAINTAGWIAGSCATEGNNPRGCIWHDGVIDELSTLDGPWSVAYGINDHNVVVGRSAYPNTAGHAVIWKKGVIADLNELVVLPDDVVLQQANAINAKGQILVYGYGGGRERWFVLAPVGTP